MREYSRYLLVLLLLCSSGLIFGQSTCYVGLGHTQSGNTVSFTDYSSASGTIVAWQWDFGDGNFDFTANPTHTYSQPGTYVYCLTIVTNDSCWSTGCDSVVIAGGPNCQAAFATTQTNASTFQFNNNSTANGTITSYLWDFGDGSFSNQANPSHAYATSGVYLPCLTITTSNNCTSTYCDSVLATAGCGTCHADYTYNINNATVTFTDVSTASNTIASWYWDFGDGSFGFGQNPAHAFAATGTYTVCLTITTIDSCVSTYCDSMYVQCGSTPTCQADFTSFVDSNGVAYFNDQSTASGTIVGWSWDFGDGNSSGVQNPSHTYNPGNYIACLTIYTSDSCSSTYCDSIYVAQPCVCDTASFTYTVSGNTVSFTNTSPGCYYSSGWIFGGGGSSTLTNPTYTYPGPGSYNACLCIYDANNVICDIVCQTIVIGSGCNLTANFSSQVNGNVANFTNLTTGGNSGTFYSWYFGDGGTSNITNPSHVYSNPGTYNVCLIAYDSLWTCYDSLCTTITIGNGCNLTANFSSQVIGNVANFTNLTTGGNFGTFYSWYFGDGATSNSTNPTHAYNNPGTYNVCLIAYDSLWACIDTSCATITIGNGCNLATAFTSQTNGNVGIFTNQTTGGNSGTMYSWYFGDGATSNTYNAAHTYSNPGTYTVCLIAYDSLWTCYDSTCATITIGSTPTCQAYYTYYPDSTGGIYFNDQSTSSSPVVAWYWDFGDGNNSTQQYPYHTYQTAGTYIACLTIFTGDSCSSTYCDSVVVTPPCNCDTAAFTYTVSGNTVTFTNTSPGCYYSSGWTFGDGGSSTLTNPTYTYSGPGTYNVCLCIYDANNVLCDIVCQTITIGGGCNVNAAFSSQVNGNTATFSNLTTGAGPGFSYYWSYGDGNSSSGFNGSNTYAAPGNYSVCLIAYDSLWSCYDSICAVVTIGSTGCPVNAAFTSQVNGNVGIFTSTTPGNGLTLTWYVDNAFAGWNVNPLVYTFPGPGTYDVRLHVYDSTYNCADTSHYTVQIGTGCNLNTAFSYTRSGNTVSFINQTTGATSTTLYDWYFGDGNFSSATNPTHTYAGSGNYWVTLFAYDSLSNCWDSTSMNLNLQPGPGRPTGGQVIPTWTIASFPNPTVGISNLRYTLNEDSPITIRVFDVNGKVVTELMHDEKQHAGEHTIEYDARQLPAGIYLYDVRAGEERHSVRFVKN